MQNFWDSNVWGFVNLVTVLLLSLLLANALKKAIKWLKYSLIPTSVLGGVILLVISGVFEWISGGKALFDTNFFGGNGMAMFEIITYHALALGFIASTFKASKGVKNKNRTVEIFNTGVNTVSTYLLQAVVGFGITIIASFIMKDFFSSAGLLLPFGYGQGTGQAMNYGGIYENEFGFSGGKTFGLTVAALGFLSASIGGVIHLNILKKHKKIDVVPEDKRVISTEEIEGENEIAMNGSIDKVTIQIALVFGAYFLTFGLMFLLGELISGMKSVIYGFNFLIGVLSATLFKAVINFLRSKNVIKKDYVNNFLMTRISNFFFDLMVVAGIAAIRLSILEKYWGIILILGVVGLVITYLYNLLTARTLFKEYSEAQFLTMFGMLTGTASTGVILLREIDPDFKTPAADNLVYQNFPAIVFGFPIMLLATLAPKKPYLTWLLLLAFLVIMNIILFRKFIFKKAKGDK